MSPQRIQRQRTKGWRMPEGALYVGRPSKWGNPFEVFHVSERDAGRHGEHWQVRDHRFVQWSTHKRRDEAFAHAVELFELHIGPMGNYEYGNDHKWSALAGRDLACWCPLDRPCHADVLLRIANGVAS